jgi:hypothetical protein
MQKTILFPLFLFTVLSMNVLAQDNTLGTAPEQDKSRKIVLLPFQPTYYMSDIDKQISSCSSNCNFDYIVNTFRAQLDIYMDNELKQGYATHTFTRDPTVENEKQLNDAYNAFKYQFDPVSERLLKDKSENRQPKIQGGQVVASTDNTPKYLDAVVADREQFSNLCRLYNSEYFILINQFEVVQDYNTPDKNSRSVKVHYAIIDKGGEHIAGGIESCTFPGETSNIQDIMKDTFPTIAKAITSKTKGPKLIKK